MASPLLQAYPASKASCTAWMSRSIDVSLRFERCLVDDHWWAGVHIVDARQAIEVVVVVDVRIAQVLHQEHFVEAVDVLFVVHAHDRDHAAVALADRPHFTLSPGFLDRLLPFAATGVD